MKRVHGGTFYTWHLHTWKKTESDPRERSILCIHRAYISSSLESRKPESKSPRACEFGARGERASDPAGEKSVSLALSALPFFLPLPSYAVRPFRMERLRERRAAQKDARLPLSFSLSYPFFLPNSCAIVNNRASQGGGNAVIYLAPESAGNARERRTQHPEEKKCFLSLQEPHATRCDVYVYTREIFKFRLRISIDNVSFAFIQMTRTWIFS